MTSIDEVGNGVSSPTPEMIERQLALLIEHSALRSSKRLVSFLQYVVRQSLHGAANQLKERTIGVEVFDRDPDYDTSNDHIVRTAASELRKRLAVYYRDEAHRLELRVDIPSGSYVPQFILPSTEPTAAKDQVSPTSLPPEESQEDTAQRPIRGWLSGSRLIFGILAVAVVICATYLITQKQESPRSLFWKPIIKKSGTALIVIGDVPVGPPMPSPDQNPDSPPIPRDPAMGFPSVSIGDAITMTRVATFLAMEGKATAIRQEKSASFSDLRESDAVLLGAFSNDWSLRLTRPLRFNLALDAQRQLIYIRDRQNPGSRNWAVASSANLPTPGSRAAGKPVQDYALVSRIVNSDTGQVVIIIGGLYMYGTVAAGEFVLDPQLKNLAKSLPLDQTKRNLQIVLETDVTEGIPGPPKVLAYSVE